MAAEKWDNPALNPTLDAAIKKGKQAGLPKDVIQKAIDKWAGNDTGETLTEIFYEWYGPGGVAMYIKCVTPNTNRSGSGVRALLTKYGGNMWDPGSVGWQFGEKGELFVSGKMQQEKIKGKEVESVLPLDEEEFEMEVMETEAEDYEIIEGVARILTKRDDFMSTVNYFEQAGWKIEQSDLSRIPENTIQLDENDEKKLETIIEALEDDEDVDTVWHNAAG